MHCSEKLVIISIISNNRKKVKLPHKITCITKVIVWFLYTGQTHKDPVSTLIFYLLCTLECVIIT